MYGTGEGCVVCSSFWPVDLMFESSFFFIPFLFFAIVFTV